MKQFSIAVSFLQLCGLYRGILTPSRSVTYTRLGFRSGTNIRVVTYPLLALLYTALYYTRSHAVCTPVPTNYITHHPKILQSRSIVFMFSNYTLHNNVNFVLKLSRMSFTIICICLVFLNLSKLFLHSKTLNFPLENTLFIKVKQKTKQKNFLHSSISFLPSNYFYITLSWHY